MIDQEQKANDISLVESLRIKIANIDKQLSQLYLIRESLVKSLEILQKTNLFIFESVERKKVNPESFRRRQVVSAVVELCNKLNRPVSSEEIIQHVFDSGIEIGKNIKITREDERASRFVGAILSHEIKKYDSELIRVERGLYYLADKSSSEPTLTAHPIGQDSTQAGP